MRRIQVAAGSALAALVMAAAPLRTAQEWTPPSRQMPEMPAVADLGGAWRGALGGWFAGLGVSVAQVQAQGEGGGARPRFVRFTSDMRPVESWSDRNGDGRADLIEVYRDGALAYQLVDSGYDGHAHVLRAYDSTGGLARETHY
jgi:hypothetical protein